MITAINCIPNMLPVLTFFLSFFSRKPLGFILWLKAMMSQILTASHLMSANRYAIFPRVCVNMRLEK